MEKYHPSEQELIKSGTEKYFQLTAGTCLPQDELLLFDTTHHPRLLDRYFPITKILSKNELNHFDQLAHDLSLHPHFDLQLLGRGKTDKTPDLPLGVTRFITGQIYEIFYFRQDLLKQLLEQPLRIRLYVTQKAYEDDGGLSGGMYSTSRKSLHLVLYRLFEGHNGNVPGVAPFLHEFGHLLDYSRSPLSLHKGLLPGMSKTDGKLYTRTSRQLFRQGKHLELKRYLACVNGIVDPDKLPVGSPYVFTNDREFLAGYFEMFFRNPNYFATQNIDLYQSFVHLLNLDPRQFWPQDFPGYVTDNRKYYLTQTPPPPGITVPKR